jgi:hypothetical protein
VGDAPAVLVGLVVSVLAVWAAWRGWGGYPRLPAPTRVLARREWAFVAAAADALLPPGGAVPPSGSEAGIPAYTDRYIASVPASTRRLMRLLLLLVEHATLVFPAPPPRGRRRFSALASAQRVAVLDGWRGSRFFARRLVFTSLRALLMMGYFAHPVVLRHLRLAPYAIATPVVEADLLYPRVGAHPATIRFTEADLTPPAPARPLDLDGPLHPDVAEARG